MPAPETPEEVLRIDSPGPLTTIQDLGRPGHRAFGVPPSGAADRFALAAANRLVGNPEGAAGLEAVLTGPAMTALRSCVVAVAGGDFGLRVNGEEAPGWTGFALAPGDRVSFAGRRSGGRCYVAVAGGIAASRWLGSSATFLLVERGGMQGRTLRKGDVLSLAGPAPKPLLAHRSLAASLLPAYSRDAELCALPGPHHARLDKPSRTAFWRESYEVSRDSDRMGFRLEGPVLNAPGKEILSIGLTYGAVQLPWSGQPILLMADHQTAGGYPVVAGVARAWLPIAAQLLPGDRLAFRPVDETGALAEWRRLRAALETIS